MMRCGGLSRQWSSGQGEKRRDAGVKGRRIGATGEARGARECKGTQEARAAREIRRFLSRWKGLVRRTDIRYNKAIKIFVLYDWYQHIYFGQPVFFWLLLLVPLLIWWELKR